MRRSRGYTGEGWRLLARTGIHCVSALRRTKTACAEAATGRGVRRKRAAAPNDRDHDEPSGRESDDEGPQRRTGERCMHSEQQQQGEGLPSTCFKRPPRRAALDQCERKFGFILVQHFWTSWELRQKAYIWTPFRVMMDHGFMLCGERVCGGVFFLKTVDSCQNRYLDP